MHRIQFPKVKFVSVVCCLFILSVAIGREPIPVHFSIPFTNQLGPNTVIIPFSPLDKLIMLKARINGQEGNFILDTGANGLVLNDLYFNADRLIKNTVAYGLSGVIKKVGILQTDSLQLDELVFAGAKAQVINLNHIERDKNTIILGLIGYQMLREFEIMFQYHQRYLTFSRVDAEGEMIDPLPHTLDKQDSISFKIGHHIPVIEIKVGGIVKKMGIDTGAEYNLLNKRSCRDVLSHFAIKKKLKITGANKKAIEVLAGKLSKVLLKDRYPCGSMSTLLVNFNQLNQIYKMKLDGILGYQFLAPWTFSINYRKKQLFLHKLKFNKP